MPEQLSNTQSAILFEKYVMISGGDSAMMSPVVRISAPFSKAFTKAEKARLVGDPAMGGKMDFAGFMEAYSQFYGTPEQPRLPTRSTVQVAGLVQPGMLVEIEVTLARPLK